MKVSYDINAPKRPVNLSLNADLVERARKIAPNLSAEVESLLVGFLERRQADHLAEVDRLRRTSATWNAFAERNGSFADEFSTL
ncbi:MAG: type II toxin-antitoxin system CcdA family antitoxin [Sinimarinibacterium flocculans]|uniref:type II toxin-antitoxin system CcdA family antitoxin n=1 Tax=Sinimarinibacterium flocculans TaxID=985250 RepID=UPI003C6326F6